MSIPITETSNSATDLQNLSDEDVVALCKQELPDVLNAYREILKRYEGMMYNYCAKYLGSAEDAEEVAQDAMLQVFHKIHQFEGRSSFRTWLYKIVQNFCKRRISKFDKRNKQVAAFEEKHYLDESGAGNNAQSDSLSDTVTLALSKLKEKEREVLIMKFVSGLTIEEISNILEIGLSAAKMRLYRAQEAFKPIYEKLERHNN